eukprot:scaffold431_cov334-Pavlova_lutheri.AAC.20
MSHGGEPPSILHVNKYTTLLYMPWVMRTHDLSELFNFNLCVGRMPLVPSPFETFTFNVVGMQDSAR